MKSLLALIVSVLTLVACGETTPTPPNPPEPQKVTRLEITPAGLLLTKAGETQAFTAKAFDAENREIQTSFTWASSNLASATVDSSGKVTAVSDAGSAQIFVQVDTVKSAPALVMVAQPVAGVLLVTDAQIISEPTLVDPNAEDDIENPYEVLIEGITPPAAGSLLLGREGKSVGGEVISSQIEGNAVRVRLKIVSLDLLLQNAKIDEVMDFSRIKAVFPAEITDVYDVQLIDGEYIFTPKPGVKVKTGNTKRVTRALSEAKVGPFKCEFGTPELPISLSQPAKFSLKLEPSVELIYDQSRGGLQKIALSADASFKMTGNLSFNLGGVLNLKCETSPALFEKLIPAPGAAGLILALQVKGGVGFEIEGNLNIPLLGAELNLEIKGKLEVGMNCTTGTCELFKNFDPVITSQVRFVNPQNAVSSLRTEFFVFGYGFAELKMGATFIEKARIKLLTLRAGLKLEGNFATTESQLVPSINALEPDYKSSYKLGLLIEGTAGPKNIPGEPKPNPTKLEKFKKLLFKLGIFSFNILKQQISKPLATSPKGTATLNRGKFLAGEKVKFHVSLDPKTIDFPILFYNIDYVTLLQYTEGEPPREIARSTATAGQSEFDLEWVADSSNESPSGQKFYAFVNTKIPSIFDLELGAAVPLEYSTLIASLHAVRDRQREQRSMSLNLKTIPCPSM